MNNMEQEGVALLYTNDTSADVSSGDLVESGNRVFVAEVDIAVDESGTVLSEGVFELPATTSQAWTFGQQLYRDAVTGKLTSTAGANKSAGFAAAVKAADATTGWCKINA